MAASPSSTSSVLPADLFLPEISSFSLSRVVFALPRVGSFLLPNPLAVLLLSLHFSLPFIWC